MEMRIGNGYDIHPLVLGKNLVLGGIKIPYSMGLDGHSDGDCLLHAISDALLGAIGAKDIGCYFRDNDPHNEGINSQVILEFATNLVSSNGYQIANIDNILIASQPKISPYYSEIRNNIAKILKLSSEKIGLKSKTGNNVYSEIQKANIACFSTCLLIKN